MAISRVALVIVALSSLLVALAHGSQEFMRINDHLNSLVPLLQEQVRVELRLVGFGDEIILAVRMRIVITRESVLCMAIWVCISLSDTRCLYDTA